jgi:hypothetical protein
VKLRLAARKERLETCVPDGVQVVEIKRLIPAPGVDSSFAETRSGDNRCADSGHSSKIYNPL